MNRKVFKYIVPADDITHSFAIPGYIKIVHVGSQGSPVEAAMNVCVWVEVRPGEVFSSHRFRVFGTGHEIPDEPWYHVGSTIVLGGRLVWHLYHLGTP